VNLEEPDELELEAALPVTLAEKKKAQNYGYRLQIACQNKTDSHFFRVTR
jgi:hypothetical protein